MSSEVLLQGALPGSVEGRPGLLSLSAGCCSGDKLRAPLAHVPASSGLPTTWSPGLSTPRDIRQWASSALVLHTVVSMSSFWGGGLVSIYR